MDVAFLAAVASGVVLLIVVLSAFSRRISGGLKIRAEEQQRAPREPQIRRAAGVRNARQRLHGNAVAAQPARAAVDRSGEESNDDAEEKAEAIDPKLGAKKRAKLEAKAERKTQREVVEREREERRKRDQLLQEERDRQSEKERAVELQREEAEKKAREEKERREYEEYLKMKEAFSVEEEGYEESNAEEQTNLLQEFLDYIKQNKVVILEDLAAHFGLKTMSVIERIHELQANGSLTGVIDDRGKFIYISQDELEAVAKFVRQYGRVSIAELAENSNRLINLNSDGIARDNHGAFAIAKVVNIGSRTVISNSIKKFGIISGNSSKKFGIIIERCLT